MMAMNGFGSCSPESFKQAHFKTSVLNNVYIGQSMRDVYSQIGRADKSRNIKTAQGGADLWEYRLGSDHCRNFGNDKVIIISQNGIIQSVGKNSYARLNVANMNRYPEY